MPLAIYRGDVLSRTISSIGWGATMTVSETDRNGIRFIRYRPPPAEWPACMRG
jgi:hypothetical protein